MTWSTRPLPRSPPARPVSHAAARRSRGLDLAVVGRRLWQAVILAAVLNVILIAALLDHARRDSWNLACRREHPSRSLGPDRGRGSGGACGAGYGVGHRRRLARRRVSADQRRAGCRRRRSLVAGRGRNRVRRRQRLCSGIVGAGAVMTRVRMAIRVDRRRTRISSGLRLLGLPARARLRPRQAHRQAGALAAIARSPSAARRPAVCRPLRHST